MLGHNYALGKTASQSTTYNDLKAGIAVDGVTALGLFSHTEFISNQWWKVDLGKVIIFQYARIYPRAKDDCKTDLSPTACSKWLVVLLAYILYM